MQVADPRLIGIVVNLKTLAEEALRSAFGMA